MRHVEALVDAGLATLMARLPDKIEELNAEPDALELEVPGEDAYHFAGVVPFPPVMPAVELTATDADMDEFDLAQQGFRTGAVLWAAAWATDADHSRLIRRAYRYGRALTEVLTEPDAFGDHAVVLRVRASYRAFIDQENRDAAVYNGGAMLMITLGTVEQRVG